MRAGYLDKRSVEKLDRARQLICSSKLHVDETPGLDTFQIAARLRRMVAQSGPLGLIVTDFMQLAKAPRRTENRVREIAYGLCEIAKEFSCPMIGLSQVSRKVEDREDKRPVLSDLEGGGAIEQAANVAFPYRPGYYERDNNDPRLEMIVAKHRGGRTGTIKMHWQADITRFANAAQEGVASRNGKNRPLRRGDWS